MKVGGLLLTLVIVVITTQNTFAANKATIFYLDKHYNPVVRLDRLGPMTDALRAILAMYTLQSGAGCAGHIGKKDGLNCALTEALGIGGQCSSEHINIVRTWFRNSIPKMSGYAEDMYRTIQAPGSVEAICYRTPDTASIQEVWDIIRITTNKKRVLVDAHGGWVTREEFGDFRYITEYEIGEKAITVITHKRIPTLGSRMGQPLIRDKSEKGNKQDVPTKRSDR